MIWKPALLLMLAGFVRRRTPEGATQDDAADRLEADLRAREIREDMRDHARRRLKEMRRADRERR
jgi:hypothetical protein